MNQAAAMDKDAKIYVTGHRGMVGSALCRRLRAMGFTNLLTRTHDALDLTRQHETELFFERERPDYVFHAAGLVGGILANNTYPADFLYQNLMIAGNVIQASTRTGVKKLLNLGSACIYPKLAPQPIKEEYLLTGALEPTNEAYAVAKISAIKLCRYYNEQYGTHFLSVMPINLYGPNDNYDLERSHLLPAFIRKFHLAKLLARGDLAALRRDIERHGALSRRGAEVLSEAAVMSQLKELGVQKEFVVLWGSGKPRRELLYVEDLADACVFLMQRYDASQIGEFVNVGTGRDLEVREIAQKVKEVVGFEGAIRWDPTKPEGMPQKQMDVSRLTALGWTAKTDLLTGIQAVYRAYASETGPCACEG